MTRVGRAGAIAVLAVAAACSKGGSKGGNAGSSGSGSGSADVQSTDGVVASVKEHKVQVKTQDGRTVDFSIKDDTKVTLGGAEASTAVVTQGAPVRVAYKGKDDVVSIDVEPKVHAGSAEKGGGSAGSAGEPPAAGRFQAEGGNQGDAHATPPTRDSGRR